MRRGIRDLRHFLIEEIPAAAGQVVIRGPEARHIALVLRMRPGDDLILGDRKGSRFLAKIETVEHRAVRVALKAPCRPPEPPPVEITLCQAVLKSQAMDTLIQKVSELGAERIIPFFSERTVVRLDRERIESKLRRWQEVARSAAKQCGRVTPLEIRPPLAFRDLLADWEPQAACKVVLWEREAEGDLQRRLAERERRERFVGLVGPEGGFSAGEVGQASAAGFSPVSLGRRILRAETAGIALVTIVQYEWGDLGRADPPAHSVDPA